MIQTLFREDDMLSVYGKYLEEKGYKLFSISGNQQGRYWYNIGMSRKGPDVVAVKGDEIIVGEGKLKSRDLFSLNANGISDYDSIKYLLDSTTAYSQLMGKIEESCKKVGVPFSKDKSYIKGIVVGGTPFNNLLEKMDDKRIGYVYVDVKNGVINEST